MSTKLKIFSICCGMALACIVSTTDSTAKGPDGTNLVHCYGDTGKCGVTPSGIILFGTAIIMD